MHEMGGWFKIEEEFLTCRNREPALNEAGVGHRKVVLSFTSAANANPEDHCID
jgi:hypothetical protein